MNAKFREIPAVVRASVMAGPMSMFNAEGVLTVYSPGDLIVERADGSQFGMGLAEFRETHRPSSAVGKRVLIHAAELQAKAAQKENPVGEAAMESEAEARPA